MTLRKAGPYLGIALALALCHGAAAQSPMSADAMAKALGLGGSTPEAKTVRPRYRAPSFDLPPTNGDQGGSESAPKQSVSVVIEFNLGSAHIRPGSMAQVHEVDVLLRQFPSLNLAIVGHTDASGDAATNQALSERRARAVRELLVARGVAPGRLSSSGRGESEPLAGEPVQSPRNRRVEFIRTDPG